MSQALRTSLYKILTDRFDESELETLCFVLEVEYDDLPGEGKAAKARDLIKYFTRRDSLDKLVETGEHLRPEIQWPQVPKPSEIKSASVSSHSPWSKEPGGEIAVRLTPKSYPAKLNKVKLYITSLGKPWTQFGVRIYDSDKADEPGSCLNQGLIFGAGKLGDEWIELDVSEQNITVQEGDFFISMVWLTSPGQRGGEAQLLGAKENRIIPGRTYYRFEPNGRWFHRHKSNCIIQAIVNNDTILDNP